MPLAAIQLSFDPALHLGPLDIRWQTIGVTVALLAGLALAARRASYLPPPGRGSASTARLRLDDLAYIVLGAVPGAVIGGRLAHGLVYWEAYASDPLRLLDVGTGSLSLTGAILGGALTAAYVCRMLGQPVRRWADMAAVPLLVAIGLGKLAQLAGGAGQGAPYDGSWAVAFVGDGPWHSLSPATAAHPSQVYEGLSMLLGAAMIRRISGGSREHLGAAFGFALAWFLLARLLVGFTWRDADLVGPLNGEQVLALVGLVGIGALLVRRRPAGGPTRRRSEPVG